MASNEYTEKQLKVINGEFPIESMTGQGLYQFYKKAIANNDEALARKIKTQQDVLKEERRKRGIQRATERLKKIDNNEKIEWRQPKSNEYTDHQKQIVRGEIPYEKVHTNELISIHMKARSIGDYELSERLLDLITARRKKSTETRALNRKVYGRFRKGTRGSSYNFYSDTKYNQLNPVEQAILEGGVTIDECLEAHLTHIMKIAKNNNDAEMYMLAEKLLFYKQYPEDVYVVHNHQEAVDMLEELLQLPIRRPSTWFVDE